MATKKLIVKAHVKEWHGNDGYYAKGIIVCPHGTIEIETDAPKQEKTARRWLEAMAAKLGDHVVVKWEN